MKSKSTKLKELISDAKNTGFLMEAHNGLSAKIVEEVGFSGIWASGLSISASLGVRDNNEVSWTQVLDVVEFMADATSIPILLDGDTGYGNFNNMRRLVTKLEQRGVAGVCIEDKLFPKTNSFIDSERQPLADADEFCGKIKAAKDTQDHRDFCVVARVEAFIAGWGLNEALRRAEAYRLAGADAILVHSKLSDASEIESFMREWNQRSPVVIVPTKYYSTPTQFFRDVGVSGVIWANHNCRSAITAMQQTSKKIYDSQSVMNVEGSIATVQEIFRLQGDEELRAAEAAYLPGQTRVTNGIILAASQGAELGPLTHEIPKTLLTVGGESILRRQVDDMHSLGVKTITVTCGFGADKLDFNDIKKVVNTKYEHTSDLYSLYCARDSLVGDVVISYGDIVYKQFLLHALLTDKSDISIIVDSDFRENGRAIDFVKTSLPSDRGFFAEDIKLSEIWSEDSSSGVGRPIPDGEFVGLWKISESAIPEVISIMEVWYQGGLLEDKSIIDLLNQIILTRVVSVRYVKGAWLDVDTIFDLRRFDDLSI